MGKKILIIVLTAVFGLSLYCTASAAATDRESIAQLMKIADSLYAIGQNEEAIKEANKAADIAVRDKDEQMIVTVNTSLGVYLRSTGKIDEALACYDTALNIVTSNKFRNNPDQETIEEVATLYINLATLHVDMGHKEEAAKYARTCAEWAEKCTDHELQAQIYGNVAMVLTLSGQREDAMQYHALSYKYALETGDKNSALRAAAYTMLACDISGNRDEAGEWRKKCRELLETEEITVMTRLAYFQIECSISQRHDDPHTVIAWFDSILSLKGIQDMPFVVFDCYNNMHLSYAELSQYDSAYSILQKSNILRDSLYEEQKVENMRELTVKYDAQEKELALARSKAAQANIRFYLVAASATLVIVGFIFIMYAMKQRRRRQEREMEFATLRRDTEKLLTTRYIEGLENERARMARELHDGVCNDLTAIQMSLREENPSSPALRLLDTCREQVRRISHEMMPPEFSYATIDEVLRYYIYKLDKAQTACRCSYASQPTGADWQVVPDSLALEIYRIVQEATGNTIKHAKATDIHVNMTRTDNGIELSVSDNGHTHSTQSSGIGMRTMKQRAAAIGGNLSIESNSDGTTVLLKLDIKKPISTQYK